MAVYNSKLSQVFSPTSRKNVLTIRVGSYRLNVLPLRSTLLMSNDIETKACTGCLRVLPLSSFGLKDKYRGYLNNLCRECASARVRHYYATNPEYKNKTKQRVRKWNSEHPRTADQRRSQLLKHRYNLTLEQHEEIFNAQGRKCAMCGADEHGRSGNGNRKTESWPIDHDHETGKVRGIVCHSCNTQLGGYEVLLRRIGQERIDAFRAGTFAPDIAEKVQVVPKNTPEWLLKPRQTDEQRFWTFVKKDSSLNGCWEWTGTFMSNGYPYFALEGGKQLCSRLVWKYQGKSLSSKQKLINECGNKACINPDHFFTGTQSDVAIRSVELRESGSSVKTTASLTDEQVLSIVRDTRDYETIANEYGLHRQRVYELKSGKMERTKFIPKDQFRRGRGRYKISQKPQLDDQTIQQLISGIEL